MSPAGVPNALCAFQIEPEALFQEPKGVPGRARGSAPDALRAFQRVPRALARVPIALKGVVILKTLIQIDGAIGADDLHLAHDIPYVLGSVRCVV